MGDQVQLILSTSKAREKIHYIYRQQYSCATFHVCTSQRPPVQTTSYHTHWVKSYFYNIKMALPVYETFCRKHTKELKIMGPHNLCNLNKKNLELEQLMCNPLYAANIITFLPD